MKGGTVIKSFLAGVLLVLFAFSITPKKTLHDLVADHIDWSGVCAAPCKDHIEPTGPHCEVAQLVAESPFVLYEQALPLVIAKVYSGYSGFTIPSYHSCYRCFTEQRGPPVLFTGMPVAVA
jgi:hypothetical protein